MKNAAKLDGNPIFIGGEGRSGTTLLSVILDSHPALAIGPELHFRGPKNLGPFIIDCIKLKRDSATIEDWLTYKKIPEYYHGVNFVIRCNRFGISDDVLFESIHKVMFSTKSKIEDFKDRCVLIDLIGNHNSPEKHPQRWGIKIMKDIKIAERYCEFWYKAQFIHLIRDGRDVAASQMKEHNTWGYADIEKAAEGWVDTIRKVRSKKNQLPIIEVRYEDLVVNARTVVQKILNFLKVSWNEQVLTHEKARHSLFEQPFNHPSIPSVVQPINTSSVGRYKNDLNVREIDVFNNIADHYLKEYGYL